MIESLFKRIARLTTASALLLSLLPLWPDGAKAAPTAEGAPLLSGAEARELFARLSGGDRTGGVPPREERYEAPEQPTVYLTFDDGPSALTPQVLDVLKQYGVPATFFVLGELAQKREDTVRRIVREGHALGNHTYNHKYDELYGSFDSFLKQVRRTEEILQGITGERTPLLRAPGGTATNFDAFYFYYLNAAGYIVYDWSIDSGDSKRRGVPAAEIIANVKRAQPGSETVVLLHDGAGHEQSLKALPDIIEYFQARGYRFAALNERVKPVTFRVGKVKWNRHIGEAEHERLLALVQAEREVAVLAAKAGEAAAGAAEGADAALAADAVAPEARGLAPIRAWAERTGAAVDWDTAAETASVAVGGKTIYWHVPAGEGWMADENGAGQAIDFKMELHDGRLYAPLAALEAM